MMTRNAFGSKSFSCCSAATAAASHAHIDNQMDTAVFLVVSICVVCLLNLRVLLGLM